MASTTKPPLTVHNAEIRTATVEIKTLTVSGKQVTLAVFRQIPLAKLVADDWSLYYGTPWGTVNYHAVGCSPNTGPHIHVVWQDKVDLRHAVVTRPDEVPGAPIWLGTDGSSWLEAAVLDGMRPKPGREALRQYGLRPRFDGFVLEIDGDEIHETVLDVLHPHRVFRTYLNQGMSEAEFEDWAKQETERRAEEALSALRTRTAGLPPLADLRATTVAKLQAAEDERRRIIAAWDALRELPQLFIAV